MTAPRSALLGIHWSIAIVIGALAAASSMSVPQQNSSTAPTIFDLPSTIDEDDLLQEYGRFMLSSMNASVNPCEDFYEYACGNWKHAALVPPKLRNNTFLHAIQENIDGMLHGFLQNTTDAELQLGTAESKAKMFYSSCVKMQADMARGYKQLMESSDFGSSLKNKSSDWISINFMSDYGVYPLMPLKVHYNTATRTFDLQLNTPTVILGNPELVDVKNLTRDFKIDGEERVKQFTDDLMEMVKFEKNLTGFVSKRNESQEMTVAEFLASRKEDRFNWTRYFDVAFNGSVSSDWTVHNMWDDVNGFVRFLNKTELSTLTKYVQWRTLLKFYYIWKASTKEATVHDTCREHTARYFNYALIPWFIEKAYDPDRRADILQIAKEIKKTFYGLIEKYTWLDDETKSHAKTKLSAMDIEVGYSDEMSHRDVIDQVYADLNITDDWYENVLVIESNRARVRMRSVNKAILPALMSTRDVNAYYADFMNMAHITIGIAQLPMYHMKFPPSLKYGGIGNIIGHEMAHGFDTYCYQFNYDGKKENWWSAAALRNFRERYRCLESQYNKYIFHGVPTNGTLTSGDNIADNVGTRMSYHAYLKAYGEKDGERKPIPGANFSNKQLFFVKFAQTWCTGKDDATTIKHIKTDVHAYEEFRVVGTLSNMPEFSEAFKCKLGTAMNPLKKCVVW